MANTNGTIEHGQGGTLYTGNAVNLYRVAVIKQGLKAAKIGMRVTRNVTPTKLLAMAGEVTGKVYKRGCYDAAIADIEAWLEAQQGTVEVKRG